MIGNDRQAYTILASDGPPARLFRESDESFNDVAATQTWAATKRTLGKLTPKSLASTSRRPFRRRSYRGPPLWFQGGAGKSSDLVRRAALQRKCHVVALAPSATQPGKCAMYRPMLFWAAASHVLQERPTCAKEYFHRRTRGRATGQRDAGNNRVVIGPKARSCRTVPNNGRIPWGRRAPRGSKWKQCFWECVNGAHQLPRAAISARGRNAGLRKIRQIGALCGVHRRN